MKAYTYANSEEPYYMPHKGKDINVAELKRLGIQYEKVEMSNDIVNEMINRHLDQYPAHDVIKLTKETPREKLDMFFEEHLHDDAEVRFIIDGCGYFDIRSDNDEWIRIKVERGDFIIIPAGSYHRFTIDEHMNIQALRLFELVPKWTPINRSDSIDKLEVRQSYLSKIKATQ